MLADKIVVSEAAEGVEQTSSRTVGCQRLFHAITADF